MSTQSPQGHPLADKSASAELGSAGTTAAAARPAGPRRGQGKTAAAAAARAGAPTRRQARKSAAATASGAAEATLAAAPESAENGNTAFSHVLNGLGRIGRSWLTPSGLAGAALETAWMTAHLALYPSGLVGQTELEPTPYGMRGLQPVARGLFSNDVEAAGTPIILIHGLADNRAIFTLLNRGLRRKGFHRLISVNYSPTTNDIREAAATLGAEIDRIVETTGFERVHIIGHSLGGLIARYYVQRQGGSDRVHTLITLGSPHRGSVLAHALPIRLGRQLRPGSRLLAELDQPAPDCSTRMIAYWSDTDQLIVPPENARIDHPDLFARNVELKNVGHMSLPINSQVVHEISTTLAHLSADGVTTEAS